MGIPSLFLVVFWLALWLTWPRGSVAHTAGRMPLPRVAFVRFGNGDSARHSMPDMFARSSRTGSRLPAGRRRVPAVIPSLGERPPMYLRRGEDPAAGDAAAALRRDLLTAPLPPGRFHLSKPAGPVFATVTNAVARVRVEARGRLRERGYAVEETLFAEVTGNGKPWLVTADVETGADGRVERVFLLRRAEDASVNACVVRALYRGRLALPGPPCRGRVLVGFGAP